MKRRGAYISIAIAAVVIALLVVQISGKQWKKDENLNVTAKALPVTIASVVQYEFADEISAVGTLKARDMSPLSPKVAGTVNRVLVDIGERVKAGEVVIKLDRTNYDLGVKQAQAALAAAEAAVPQACRDSGAQAPRRDRARGGRRFFFATPPPGSAAGLRHGGAGCQRTG